MTTFCWLSVRTLTLFYPQPTFRLHVLQHVKAARNLRVAQLGIPLTLPVNISVLLNSASSVKAVRLGLMEIPYFDHSVELDGDGLAFD